MSKEALLVGQWVPRLRAAVERLRESVGEERLYALALYTTDEAAYVVLSANTEEGLERRVATYDGEPALQRQSLRWSPADWDRHCFEEDPLQWFLWQRFAGPRTLLGAMRKTLAQLDQEGLFGQGEARAALTLGVFKGDESDAARRKVVLALNPPEVAERFGRELKAGRQAERKLR